MRGIQGYFGKNPPLARTRRSAWTDSRLVGLGDCSAAGSVGRGRAVTVRFDPHNGHSDAHALAATTAGIR